MQPNKDYPYQVTWSYENVSVSVRSSSELIGMLRSLIDACYRKTDWYAEENSGGLSVLQDFAEAIFAVLPDADSELVVALESDLHYRVFMHKTLPALSANRPTKIIATASLME